MPLPDLKPMQPGAFARRPKSCTGSGSLPALPLACAVCEYPKMINRVLSALFLGLLFAHCSMLEGIAAPSARLISTHWLQNDPSSSVQADHSAWSRFLATYLVPGNDGVNRIAYGRVNAADQALLNRYITMLEASPVTRFSRPEQLAYWINLYNAATTRVVLQHYPVRSIRDIGGGLFGTGPWDAKLVTVEGERLSLDDIEHGILRPIWHDPRIHYALNCASISCPKLQPIAFTANNEERLLDEAARAYVNDPRGVRIANGRLTVSSIYAWYRDDFGSSDSAVIDHLRRYASPQLAAELARFRKPDEDAYDWGLIDVR